MVVLADDVGRDLVLASVPDIARHAHVVHAAIQGLPEAEVEVCAAVVVFADDDAFAVEQLRHGVELAAAAHIDVRPTLEVDSEHVGVAGVEVGGEGDAIGEPGGGEEGVAVVVAGGGRDRKERHDGQGGGRKE